MYLERFSKNRQAILECLRDTATHPTAEWIYEKLRPNFPNLSLGTVYRNLCQLKDAGLILSMGVVAGQEHFDGNMDPHAHVMCSRCGRIVDVPITPAMTTAIGTAMRASGFRFTEPKFVGICPECSKKSNNK